MQPHLVPPIFKVQSGALASFRLKDELLALNHFIIDDHFSDRWFSYSEVTILVMATRLWPSIMEYSVDHDYVTFFSIKKINSHACQ